MNKLLRLPLPDELWSSALARHAALLNFAGPVALHRAIFGKSTAVGTPLLPTQIRYLATFLDTGMTPEEIITKHTMLPYYECFLSLKADQARAAMMESGNVAMELGISSMKDYPDFLKACPKCVEEDLATHGSSLWRRSHQTPGALVCTRHHIPLSPTAAAVESGNGGIKLQLPQNLRLRAAFQIPKQHVEDALWLAEQSQRLLDLPQPRVSPCSLATIYRRHLNLAGYIGANECLRQANLIGDFIGRFACFLAVLGVSVPGPASETRDSWLARLLLQSQYGRPPLHHLLMMRFLNLNPAEVMMEATTTPEYQGTIRQARPGIIRSSRVTEAKAVEKREQWLRLVESDQPGSIREENDALYCWLWRNDRAWLRQHQRAERGGRGAAATAQAGPTMAAVFEAK